VTAYALRRPDGQWSLMLVNRDQQGAHKVRIAFQGKSAENFAGPVEISTFGSAQYQWHPAQTRFMAHAEHAAERTVVAYTQGWAEPDGPIARAQQNAGKGTTYELPAASVRAKALYINHSASTSTITWVRGIFCWAAYASRARNVVLSFSRLGDFSTKW
jgi:hypothetical protein